MGDHEGWVGQPSGLQPNGLLPNGAANATRVLDSERWAKAEERTAELIARIQPNLPSEQRRNAVANYVRQLIMKCFSCQVFTYGSVPLKTYLPDGDIDLTVFSKNESLKDTWALEVRDMLENEEKIGNAEFRVKEVQYIQADVKIVKCLVENVVVDISFNQVGGLCTLCFLEEIDHLINQNHLFKRSIILIKAWCYYESRILGAHHGLLSTYALETLVLYIFHVFNNSFSGPLEVLYRFLEFFSNFDWENFCVSLWGPVPISSLPDITAQTPRKDGGELLLSQPFLSACSTIYAVMQPGQEIQNQSFVSKHFNVIDPLRTNNNLGRSVSKGNFFRIRSAFAFGAKKLAVLLECPKEKLIPELNLFFMNTWERHGSGDRPDAPVSNLLSLQSFKTIQLEEETDSKSTVNKNNSKNISHARPAGVSAIPNNIDQHSWNIIGTSNEAAISHTHSQKNYGIKSNFKASNQPDRNTRNTSSSGSVISNKNEKHFKSDYSLNGHELRGRFQFARTRSSPELTDASATVTSQWKHSKFVEISKGQTMLPRAGQVSRRKNFNSEVSGGHSSVPDFNNPASTRQNSFRQPLENAADLKTVSSSITDDIGFTSTLEELDSVSEKLDTQQEMQQEGQDVVHMISSGVNNFKGQVQLPMHFASSQLHLPLSPFLASIGYAHRNMIGMVPANIPLVEPSWGSGMQFPQAHVTSTSPSFVHTSDQILNTDGVNGSANLGFGLTHVNQEAHEHDTASPRAFDLDNRGFHKPHDDENHQLISDDFSFNKSLRASNSGAALLLGQHKFSGENRSLVTEDYNDGIGHHTSRVDDIYFSENKNMRPSTMSQSGSSRSKSASDGLRGGPNGRVSKSRDKSGSNLTSSAGMNSLYGKAVSGQQCNGSSYLVSAEENVDQRKRFPSSMISNDMMERTGESASVTSHAGTYQLSEYEFVQLKDSNSMFPIGPVLIGGSHNGAENPQVVPLTFFPTGPPVPFLTMLPVCNYQSDTRTSDGSTNQFDRNKGEEDHRDPSDQNFDSVDSADQSEARLTSIVSSNIVSDGPSEGRKSDILNSDFSSHWQNLQFGRSCQNTHVHGPMIYTSPVMVPPVYLQGHFPLEAPGRPLATNANLYAQLMSYGPRFIPVTPLQQGPVRPPAVFNRFADGPPRFRGGTGTYLPNPGSFRDRQSPATRHHRGNMNHERSDLANREGSWIAAKQRAGARNHGFRQAEKQSSRLDRFPSSENRSEKPQDSHGGHGPAASSESQSMSFQSRNSTQNAANPSGPAPTTSVPSVVMFYPYSQAATDGSPAESLEFGSLGRVHLPYMTERPQPNNSNSVREVLDRRHTTYRAGSPRSSPDNPSSPSVQRLC